MMVDIAAWPMRVQLAVTRVLLGQTQAQMSNTLGISHRTYSGYETGERPIPYRTRQWLAMRIGELLMDAEADQLERRQSRESGYGRMTPVPSE